MQMSKKVSDLLFATKMWFIARGIEQGDVDKQGLKLIEEIGELVSGYLMLSTNTKDKTGKEIFEGDVLQIDYIQAIVRFGQYRYYDTAGKDVLTGNGFYLECLNVMDPDCISPYETDVLDKSEIIGNIYENPEYDQNFVGFRIKGE